jgi:BirA family biotin operon repressor/biotin-[acetyl-CoA-carboxylase] ligase
MDFQRILAETFVARAEHHEVIGSTNDRAREYAAEHLPMPLLITADRQTAGRGRGSHRWWTGQGSLAMSLMLPTDIIPEDIGQSVLVSLASAVAVVDVLRELAEQQGATGVSPVLPKEEHGQDARGTQEDNINETLGLHWPNDVVLSGRKLAGILIESLPGRAHVVGIGINTNNAAADAPEEFRDELITLRDATGTNCDHVELLVGLLQCLELGLRQLGVAPRHVARRADELCLQRGKMLTIQGNKEQITGRCRGIGPDGALLLETPEGLRACKNGVVTV